MGRRFLYRIQIAEDRKQKTEDRGQRTEAFELGIGNAEFGMKRAGDY
jgi:hypothetical protein